MRGDRLGDFVAAKSADFLRRVARATDDVDEVVFTFFLELK